jgi:hypothetical protein
MNNPIKVEKVKGRYQLYGIIIVALFGGGGLLYYFLPHKESPKETNKIKVQENKNSPVANKIETQNNYYAENQPIKDSAIPKSPVLPIQTLSKKVNSPTKSKEEKAIYANNALIVTNQQSGGTNNVNVQQIPEPIIKLVELKIQNEKVKEIPSGRGLHRDTIFLPSSKYNYDFLYKTQFTISYNCPVNLNSILFIIKREDVIIQDISHGGKMEWANGTFEKPKYLVFQITQPENGYYTFTIYTVNKFGNPMEEFECSKN